MPMELGLKLMVSICSDRMESEGEFFDHILNKLNGVLLIVTRVDLQRPDPGCIVDGRVLKASDSFAIKIPQGNKFNINLDVMARHFFGITSCVDSSARRILRKASHVVPH